MSSSCISSKSKSLYGWESQVTHLYDMFSLEFRLSLIGCFKDVGKQQKDVNYVWKWFSHQEQLRAWVALELSLEIQLTHSDTWDDKEKCNDEQMKNNSFIRMGSTRLRHGNYKLINYNRWPKKRQHKNPRPLELLSPTQIRICGILFQPYRAISCLSCA